MNKAEDRERLRDMQLKRMAAKKSGGGALALGVIGKRDGEQLPYPVEAREKGKNLSPSRVGRPRLGEERDKPWLHTRPPMSKTTWYRRQAEKRENIK